MIKIILLFLLAIFILIVWGSVKSVQVEKELKEKRIQENKTKTEKPTYQFEDWRNPSPTTNEVTYETTRFNIAGVTFKDGRLQRQTALKMLKFEDPPMDREIEFSFDEYEFENKPAIKISANGRILGNVPADLVDEFIQKSKDYPNYEVQYDVHGGNGYPYGCTIIITWK